jgi:adenylate cyclase
MTRALIALGVVAAVLAITRIPILSLGLVERLELATLDARFQVRGPSPAIPDSSHVVIVDIGEESFKAVPASFPWPRAYYARAIHNLHAAGARAIAIDLIFSGPDQISAANDSALRAALHDVPGVVIAGKREPDRSQGTLVAKEADFGTIFARDAAQVGIVNIRADADGVYRMYNPFFLIDRANDTALAVPTFAFAVLNVARGAAFGTTPVRDGSDFSYAGTIIPHYDAGSLLVNYYGPSGRFPHISFHDLIDDSTFQTRDELETGEEINTFTDPEYGYLHDGSLRGKIVLIGVTIPEYKDLFPVPVGIDGLHGSNQMYGVELHANVIESVMRGEFLRMAPFWLDALLTLAGVGLTFFGSSWIRGFRSGHHLMLELGSVALALSLLAVAAGVIVLAFSKGGMVLSATGASFGVAGGAIASMAYHVIIERRKRLEIKGMFSSYVNAAVVDELIAHPESMSLGGTRKNLTVLFSDLVGFTALAEQHSPEDLVAMLNDYMSAMTEVVFRHDGTLDKFIGDAVMAFWGDPTPREDHALRACRCALEMQAALSEMNSRWESLIGVPLAMRIGINTGDMIVGRMGGRGKFAYTVIGDSVNLASRLEGANKQYGTRILIAQETYQHVRNDIVARELDCITVKGRREPVTTHEVLALRSGGGEAGYEEFLSKYNSGIFRYRCREWDAAIRAFTAALALRPDDGPSRMYIERSQHFATNPPPANWDGVFVMQNK